MVTLTIWEKDYAAHSIQFADEDQAIEAVKAIARDKDAYRKCDGWSITDDEGYWIIEEGEKHIPIKAA